jgi:hypothetical protein
VGWAANTVVELLRSVRFSALRMLASSMGAYDAVIVYETWGGASGVPPGGGGSNWSTGSRYGSSCLDPHCNNVYSVTTPVHIKCTELRVSGTPAFPERTK